MPEIVDIEVLDQVAPRQEMHSEVDYVAAGLGSVYVAGGEMEWEGPGKIQVCCRVLSEDVPEEVFIPSHDGETDGLFEKFAGRTLSGFNNLGRG